MIVKSFWNECRGIQMRVCLTIEEGRITYRKCWESCSIHLVFVFCRHQDRVVHVVIVVASAPDSQKDGKHGSLILWKMSKLFYRLIFTWFARLSYLSFPFLYLQVKTSLFIFHQWYFFIVIQQKFAKLSTITKMVMSHYCQKYWEHQATCLPWVAKHVWIPLLGRLIF